VATLADHLAGQVDALWRDDFYTVRDGDFSMHSATPYMTAILALGAKQNKKSVSLKLQELRYLSYIFPVVQHQLARYLDAMGDVMTYVISALNSTTFVAPPLSANKNILYFQLFEEVKTLM